MTEEIEWLKQLRQALWRDVPFDVDTVVITAGQNTVLREYPFQDLPTVFSMGDGTEDIKFSGYVVGDDYLTKLEALRAVLEGEGILVHPTQGSIRCYCHGKYTVTEAPTKEGGIARLELSFVRAEERRYPVGTANRADQLADTSAKAKQSAIDRFADQFNVAGQPGWSLANIREGMRTALDTVWSTVSRVQGEMSQLDNMVNQFITYPTNELFAISSIIGNMASSIMRVPSFSGASAALSQFGTLRSLWSTPPSPAVAAAYQTAGVQTPIGASESMQNALTPQDSPYQTASRKRERAAFQCLADLLEVMATITAGEAVAQIELDNFDQALALRQDFNQQFNRMLRRGAADHDALAALQAAVLADLQARSADLARITTYTPETYQPAIYISYRLFGTVRWADEIMSMNPHIRHPLLVPPGRPLRIIKRD